MYHHTRLMWCSGLNPALCKHSYQLSLSPTPRPFLSGLRRQGFATQPRLLHQPQPLGAVGGQACFTTMSGVLQALPNTPTLTITPCDVSLCPPTDKRNEADKGSSYGAVKQQSWPGPSGCTVLCSPQGDKPEHQQSRRVRGHAFGDGEPV